MMGGEVGGEQRHEIGKQITLWQQDKIELQALSTGQCFILCVVQMIT